MPKGIVYRETTLIEPFAIDGHCTRWAKIQGGESMLVLDNETVGAVILQTLKQKGCRVICTDINESSLRCAKEYGADSVINTKIQNLKECAQVSTNGVGVNAIFDPACYPGSLTAALGQDIPTDGATVVPLGFYTGPEGITQAMINAQELSIIGIRMFSGQFEPIIQNFAQGKSQLDSMVNRYVPFDQVGQVLENMLRPMKDMKKTIVVFGEQEQTFFRTGIQRQGDSGAAKDKT